MGSAAVSPLLIVENAQLPSPASANSAAPQLASNARGEAALIWVDPGAEGQPNAVKVSTYLAGASAWSSAQRVHESPNVAVDPWDTPQLVIDNRGALTAVWPQREGAGGPLASRSRDHGATWEPATPLAPDGQAVEFASIAPRGDGAALAVWLDGRDRETTKAQSLRSRILFSNTPDTLIDPRVCDCCATGIAVFPDGSAIAVYRNRSDDEVRDISFARLKNGAWSPPAPLSRDGWKISGCPVNGPAVSANGARVVAAWPTAADGGMRVYAATSASAGEPFLMPARVDDGHPLGHVGAVQLKGGDAFVSWVEAGAAANEAFILLRRVSADGSLSVPARLATVPRARRLGVPRITLLVDYDQGNPAQLLLAYTRVEGEVSHVVTHLLTIQPPAADSHPCSLCPPDENRGSPVHGHILAMDTTKQRVRVKHDDIPGVMPAMSMWFHVSPEDLGRLKADAEIYGRIEQKEDGWWLFAIRSADEKMP